jgi:hypothetical protein
MQNVGSMDEENKRAQKAFIGAVRQSDIEPYTALRWLGTLFKSAAVFLLIAIIGEFIAGVRFEGVASLSTLLGELARTVVLAVVMWGVGDLVRLLITVGNDIRAERILLARLVFRTPLQRAQDEAGEGDAATTQDVADPHYDSSGDAAAD